MWLLKVTEVLVGKKLPLSRISHVTVSWEISPGGAALCMYCVQPRTLFEKQTLCFSCSVFWVSKFHSDKMWAILRRGHNLSAPDECTDISRQLEAFLCAAQQHLASGQRCEFCRAAARHADAVLWESDTCLHTLVTLWVQTFLLMDPPSSFILLLDSLLCSCHQFSYCWGLCVSGPLTHKRTALVT